MRDRAVGLVYGPGLDGVLASGLVNIVEIEPEMYWFERGGWERVRALPLPKIVHGVGDAIGGSVPPPADYVDRLATAARQLGARWTSHHLAFNVFEDRGATARCSFFLPPRQTRAGVAAAVASIRSVARAVDTPFAIETGVNYLAPRDDELPDGAFVAEVARGADCHILLDLHNLVANERNGRQRLERFVAALPPERIIEIHVAGGFVSEEGYWLDAHSGRPPGQVMDALREWLPRLPSVRAVVFEVLPAFVPSVGPDVIREVLEDIRRAWDLPRRPVVAPPREPVVARDGAGLGPAEWEATLGRLVNGELPGTPIAEELGADRGVHLLRRLVVQGRAGMLTSALPVTIRLLAVVLGAERIAALVERYCAEVPPLASAREEAHAFAEWLARDGARQPFLDDAVRLDLATARADASGEPVTVTLDVDPRALCEALARGALPARGEQSFVTTVTPG